MPLYDGQGNSLNTCFDKSGAILGAAYDKFGEQIYPDEITLTVMTYNVQFFNGINSQSAMQTAIVNKYNADIIGLQELGTYTESTLPSTGRTMLANYPVKQFSNHKNKTLMATRSLALSNVVIADFENQDPYDASQYNETRAYVKADFTVGGKTITWINTHLALTQSYRFLQMKEIFDIAETCDYCIITGDFNSSSEADSYDGMYKRFFDAGYNLANCSPTAGFHNTYTNSATATTLADLISCPDTIICSGNIDIESVVFDTTKFSYLNGSSIDHIPVVATLKIN